MGKEFKDLYVLTLNRISPYEMENGQIIVVTAESEREALERVLNITGYDWVKQENIMKCSIHHGRSALYVRK